MTEKNKNHMHSLAEISSIPTNKVLVKLHGDSEDLGITVVDLKGTLLDPRMNQGYGEIHCMKGTVYFVGDRCTLPITVGSTIYANPRTGIDLRLAIDDSDIIGTLFTQYDEHQIVAKIHT